MHAVRDFFHIGYIFFPLFLATSQRPPACSDVRAQPARGPGSLHIADLRKSFHKPGVCFFLLVTAGLRNLRLNHRKWPETDPSKNLKVVLQWPMESQKPWWMWGIQFFGVATGRPCERELRTVHVFGRCEKKPQFQWDCMTWLVIHLLGCLKIASISHGRWRWWSNESNFEVPYFQTDPHRLAISHLDPTFLYSETAMYHADMWVSIS